MPEQGVVDGTAAFHELDEFPDFTLVASVRMWTV